jgi:hypothetical protein
MSILFFRLRNVPDDEADDIRALLNDSHIDFYETSAGNWGISLPGIWLKHECDLDRAKKLLDTYQHHRTIEQQQKYVQLRHEGKHKTFLDAFLEDPVKFIIYIAIAVAVVYFSISPFLSLGQ